MDLRSLKNKPPWEWPADTGKMLLDILCDGRTSESELLLAAELAGDLTVVDDALVGALLRIVRGGDKPETIRARAASSLGPVLEYADVEGFEGGDVPITTSTFHELQQSLRRLYMDADVPKEVRRRILEASVRAPQDWHRSAVVAAYAGDDEAWRLTAVFCMRFVRGFEAQVLEALASENPDIHYEAVHAAGVWEVDAAWAHVAALVAAEATDKPLLLAAIDAVASIRPRQAARMLGDLADSDDEDIATAVQDALDMARGFSGEDDELDDDDDLLP